MQTLTYALPKDSQAWHNALDKVAHLLPVSLLDVSGLSNLPVFAVVMVVDRAVVPSIARLDELMVSFMQTLPKWRMQMVYDDETAKTHAHKIVAGKQLADVVMSRYLVMPAQLNDTHIKPDVARRMMDDQLTAYLRQELSADGFDRVDVHILNVAQILTKPKLVCFDMDSTLIEQEVIVELARMCGISDKVGEITERAMRGEIDFATSFAERVALLEDTPETVVDDIIKHHISFSSGAHALMRALKAEGCWTILVSGGFEPFAKYVAQTLGMDEYYANPLLTAEGKITGYIDPVVIDGKRKAQIVARSAERLGLNMAEVVCVGDGANDLPMMEISGMGIAYKAKPIVQARADVALNVTGLEGVLFALGQRFDKV
ncbi:phosphoserine phosphatase SerB [Moraxella sp. VT-16-12]|uniref:phosphoserine phosphatase SerB n=1 Tax=Moraxella sp. VT-16-12 TaxID=2014877 RepID=UPI000B7E1955|nr:phosphoserine phosphatase SerB [Moraxella sp. VT-16-12]TWV82886.1 phosphoserine phosphatase SerB [Moraxella sp. VT-16-12]